MRSPAVAALGAVLVVSACGKKGPPLPPLRPVPARILDLAAKRTDDRIDLTFTVPSANADNTTPPAIARLDVYRLLEPADAPPPTPGRVIDEGVLLTSRDVHVAGPDDASEPPAGALVPGATAHIGDVVTPAVTAGAEGPQSLWYLVVGIAGRDRQGPPSGRVEVPLSTVVLPPIGLSASFDETTLELRWEPGDETGRFVVEEILEAGSGDAASLTGEPLEEPVFRLPVEFGRTRCFVVRAAAVTTTTTIVSAPSGQECLTPVDTYPPEPPSGLLAVQESAEPVVTLRWRASTSTDGAGYVVLRGDGPDETLRPLVTEPVAGLSYRDTDVQAGRTYVYAVVAVDRASPPNSSRQSNRETIVVR